MFRGYIGFLFPVN